MFSPGVHRLHQEAGQPNQADVLRAGVADPSGAQEDVRHHDGGGHQVRPQGACPQVVSATVHIIEASGQEYGTSMRRMWHTRAKYFDFSVDCKFWGL